MPVWNSEAFSLSQSKAHNINCVMRAWFRTRYITLHTDLQSNICLNICNWCQLNTHKGLSINWYSFVAYDICKNIHYPTFRPFQCHKLQNSFQYVISSYSKYRYIIYQIPRSVWNWKSSLTICMEESASWEASSRSATQEIPCLLMKPKGLLLYLQQPTTGLYPEQGE